MNNYAEDAQLSTTIKPENHLLKNRLLIGVKLTSLIFVSSLFSMTMPNFTNLILKVGSQISSRSLVDFFIPFMGSEKNFVIVTDVTKSIFWTSLVN